MADNSESSAASKHENGNLTLYIVIAIVAAVVLALTFPRAAMVFHVGGEIFLRLLQMVVVPLVMASVMSGILGLGDVRKLGKPGGCAIVYYLFTTVLAVGTGLVVVNIIQPHRGVSKNTVQEKQREGQAAISKARREAGEAGEFVTWNSGARMNPTRSGVSDEFKVDPSATPMLMLKILQEGDAEQPASVVIEVSESAEDGEKQFRPLLEKPFLADKLEGSYSRTVDLPKNTSLVRLVYTAQVGGIESTLTAELVRGPPGIGHIFENLLLMLFTNNLLKSMVEMQLLPLILFSLVFAGMLTTMGKRAELVSNVIVSINDALMQFIMLLMKAAPLGIFCLVTARFGEAQAEGEFFTLLKTLALYMATVLSGLLIHALVTLPLIFWIFTRRNPYRFLFQMSQAVLTAFSTASSSATLPVTMECAEYNGGVRKRSTEFVLPLGATVNMDGTALYEAAAAIFIANSYALVDPTFELDFVGQMTIAITATLAAIGAAGIPEAGLVTMLIVLNAVGLPIEMIGLILPVDWLLDRFRTAVNVFGDSAGAAIIDGTFPDD